MDVYMITKTRKGEASELDKFFVLYQQFWPKQEISANKRLAWGLALEPYKYEEVKAAAVQHARKFKFPPDIAELTAGLTPEEPEEVVHQRDWVDVLLDKLGEAVPNPITAYAAQHGITVGEAEKRMGTTWDEEREAQSDL